MTWLKKGYVQCSERTRVYDRNVYVEYSKGNNSNVGKPKLRFMCSASCFIVLYICVKFRENIDRTRVHSSNGYFQYALCSKGRNSKSRVSRVTVFVFCILSYDALHL